MRWTERQQAMLAAMGVRLWERETAADADADAGVEAKADAESSAGVTPHRSAGESAAAASVAREPAPPDFARRQAPASVSRTRDPGVDADWLLVGEPLDEARAQLLDNMLRAIGVTRSAPTRAGRATLFEIDDRLAGAVADPESGERLRSAVAAARPRCIVALGRGAAQALLSTDESLGALRGRRHDHAGVAVIVTCPLAFLLRHPEEKAKAWADLCLAVVAADAAADPPA